MSKKGKSKNFFQILKSNPQTLEEAKQKTKTNTILVAAIFGIFAILFCFLSIVIGLLWAVVAAGITFYLYCGWRKRDKRNFCSECGTKFDYERCVSWQIANVERKSVSSNSNSSDKRITQKEVATVNFTCICENCGNQKSFSNKFDTVVWYSDGSRKQINLHDVAKSYFKL